MAEYINGNAPRVLGPGPRTTTTTYKASTMNVQSVTTLSQNNMDSSTAVVLWDLENPRIKHAVESEEIKESIALLAQNDIQAESVIDDGKFRAKVSFKDYAPGGKYRGKQTSVNRIRG